MSSANSDSLPRLLYALSVIFVVLPIVVVGLRFQVKTKSNPRIFWDDWMILLALVCRWPATGAVSRTDTGTSYHASSTQSLSSLVSASPILPTTSEY